MVCNAENTLMLACFTIKVMPSKVSADEDEDNVFTLVMDGASVAMPSKPCRCPLMIFPRKHCIAILEPSGSNDKHQ
jgi:hypothetical protein